MDWKVRPLVGKDIPLGRIVPGKNCRRSDLVGLLLGRGRFAARTALEGDWEFEMVFENRNIHGPFYLVKGVWRNSYGITREDEKLCECGRQEADDKRASDFVARWPSVSHFFKRVRKAFQRGSDEDDGSLEPLSVREIEVSFESLNGKLFDFEYPFGLLNFFPREVVGRRADGRFFIGSSAVEEPLDFEQAKVAEWRAEYGALFDVK